MTILKKNTKKTETKKEPVLDEVNKERMDALKDAIQELQKFKKIKGFMLLVDASNDETRENGKNGLRIHCGPMPVLANLYMNIDEEIVGCAKRLNVVADTFESDFEDILKKIKKLTESMDD